MSPFKNPKLLRESLTSDLTLALVAEASDVSLLIDKEGVIQDVALGGHDSQLEVALSWVGSKWSDTVTTESRNKINLLLNPVGNGDDHRWRQVNHETDTDSDLPVMYKTIAAGNGLMLAVGRDLSQVSRLQQRLLDVQQSLERDYARLHQAEIRYRMLFSMTSEAILFVDADSRKVIEANPAAGKLLGKPVNRLINRAFPRGFSDNSNDAIEELLIRVRAAGKGEAVIVRSATDQRSFRLNASLVRREDGHFFFIRLAASEESGRADATNKAIEILDRSPDAFVITDPDGRILSTNRAFLDLCSIAAELQVINQPLDRWLGRPGVDTSLLIRNLRNRPEVRHFTTNIYPEYGEPIEVELSAVSALESDEPCFGFIIRRHMVTSRGSSESTEELPRSLKEMTYLVGRVPLKDLVRETTDIIERMCIETALKMTDDSRASAAEMLGLSRQSLYVKLRRYGIGGDEDAE